MEAARQQLERSIWEIQGLDSVAEKSREDTEADLFKAVRESLKHARKNVGMLDGILEADRIRTLEFIHGRGVKKKVHANQARECLKIILASDDWTAAACASEELHIKLHEFLAGDAALQAKLGPPLASAAEQTLPTGELPPVVVDAAAHPAVVDEKQPLVGAEEQVAGRPDSPSGSSEGSEPQAAAFASAPFAAPEPAALEPSIELVQRLVLQGVGMMRELRWEYPTAHGEFDSVTEACKLMYEALTMLAALCKRDDLAAQKALAELDRYGELDWAGALRFLSATYSAKNRKTLRPKVADIAGKLSKFVPAFQSAAASTPPPWAARQQADAKGAHVSAPLGHSQSSELTLASDRYSTLFKRYSTLFGETQ